jgi:hypothetical protein
METAGDAYARPEEVDEIRVSIYSATSALSGGAR